MNFKGNKELTATKSFASAAKSSTEEIKTSLSSNKSRPEMSNDSSFRSLIAGKDYILVTRCYNCWGFGHISTRKDKSGIESECASPQVCSHCAGNHRYAQCVITADASKASCVNCCRERVKTGNKSIRTDHPTSSERWPN